MSAVSAGFPNAPLIDPAGNLAPVWRSFLLALFIRTGTGTGVSSADTAAALIAETGARTAGDTALSAAVSTEASARTAAIGAEATTRAKADAALAARIATLGGSTSPALLSRIWFGH